MSSTSEKETLAVDEALEDAPQSDRRRKASVTIVMHFHGPVILGPEISIEALIPYLANARPSRPT